jgi:hypothetical protein
LKHWQSRNCHRAARPDFCDINHGEKLPPQTGGVNEGKSSTEVYFSKRNNLAEVAQLDAILFQAYQMLNVIIKHLVVIVPTCAIGAGGFWLALKQTGIWCVAGWIGGVLFGVIAALEMFILISGLVRINQWKQGVEQHLEELQQRDAELFAQGKSFDEVMSQYKKPKS